MEFKYFKYPDKYSVIIDEDVECDICGKTQRCFDAESYLGEEEITAICPDCLRAGRLRGRSVFTNEGDVDELRHQLTILNPHITSQELEERIETKKFELEQATPHILTWQDWAWPCADGDFCQFLRYGSKEDFNRFAQDGNGKHVFATTLYKDLKELSDIDEIWEALPESPIQSLDDTNYSILCYIFKSLSGHEIITIWDCD